MEPSEEWNNDRELRRTISGPISAKIKTMNNSSFLVFSEANHEEDSDEEDLDRYTDVGLREQLFITLSRAIRSTQSTETKITESAIPDSIKKNKRGPQRRKLLKNNDEILRKSPKQVPLRLPKNSMNKVIDSHSLNHNNELLYDEGNGLKQNKNKQIIKKHKRQRSNIREYSPRKTKESALKQMKLPKIALNEESHSMPTQSLSSPLSHNINNDDDASNHIFKKHQSENINFNRSIPPPPPPPLPTQQQQQKHHKHHKSVCIINTKTKKKIYKNIPPPPKSPPPQNPKIIKNDIFSHVVDLDGGKQRKFRHSEYQQIVYNEKKDTNKDKNNLSPRQMNGTKTFKHSYNGPSFGALSVETEFEQFDVYKQRPSKPEKKAPVFNGYKSQTPKIQKSHQMFTPFKSNKYKPARNRTRSHSKDDVDINKKSFKFFHKVKELPPSPIKNGKKNLLISNGRNHAASVQVTQKKIMTPPPSTTTSPPLKYFGKMRNEIKYNGLSQTQNNVNYNQPKHQKAKKKFILHHHQNIHTNGHHKNNATGHNHIVRYHDSNSMESQSSSMDRELTGYSTHSYSNSETLTSHSSQNSNPFIPPSPQKVFKTRNSFKHRPIAPMQVYSHLPVRQSVLKKIKAKKVAVSNEVSPKTFMTMPTNVRLEPMSPSFSSANEESENELNPIPHSPLDTMDNVFVTSPIVTRKRSGNHFMFNHEGDDDDAASTDDDGNDENENEHLNESMTLLKPPTVSIPNTEHKEQSEEDDVGHSDIPLSLPDYLSASEFMLGDPTLDPKRNLKHKSKQNAVKNIRARGATWIGQANNSTKNTLLSSSPTATDRLLLSPSITAPAVGSIRDRNDSLANVGQILIDGHIVLNKKDLNSDLLYNENDCGRDFLKDPNAKFPIFQSMHQRYAQETAIKVFDGNLKSYQRAFVPINPRDLGLKDYSNMRSRRRAVFGGEKLGAKAFTDIDSTMDISNEQRQKSINLFLAQLDHSKKKRFKKSTEIIPAKKQNSGGKGHRKQQKLSMTSTSSSNSDLISMEPTLSSYSLSIANELPMTNTKLRSTNSDHLFLYDDDGMNEKQIKNKHSWKKIFSFGRKERKKRNKKSQNKPRKSTDYHIYDNSLTLDHPSNMRQGHKMNAMQRRTTKDDTFIASNQFKAKYKSFDYDDAMYRTQFEMNQITQTVKSTNLKRGDLIFIMDYEMIDIEHENLKTFLSKYKMKNFLKRMENEEKQKIAQLQMAKQRSTMRLMSLSKQKSFLHPTTANKNKSAFSSSHIQTQTLNDINEIISGPKSVDFSPQTHATPQRLRARGDGFDYTEDFEDNSMDDDLKMIQDLEKNIGSSHCMIVLQNIGSSVEIAHVTSHGGTRSFIREFDAEKIAQTLYLRSKHGSAMNAINDEMKYNEDRSRSPSNKLVEALGRGPPVAYRCVVYRLDCQVTSSRKMANEAANVAENLIKGGRLLADQSVFAGSQTRYTQNPEKYFYRFLLSSNASLFRRTVRLQFDAGGDFFNFSSSEFVALCFQRALVNKKSFDRQLIRLLDFCPHLTPPSLLQKYLHLNIDEHGDWKCLGNVFFSYL